MEVKAIEKYGLSLFQFLLLRTHSPTTRPNVGCMYRKLSSSQDCIKA